MFEWFWIALVLIYHGLMIIHFFSGQVVLHDAKTVLGLHSINQTLYDSINRLSKVIYMSGMIFSKGHPNLSLPHKSDWAMIDNEQLKTWMMNSEGKCQSYLLENCQ